VRLGLVPQSHENLALVPLDDCDVLVDVLFLFLLSELTLAFQEFVLLPFLLDFHVFVKELLEVQLFVDILGVHESVVVL